MKLVLASSSPARKKLLARLGLPFEIYAPDLDETALAGEEPEALVRRLSLAKAQKVAERFPESLIIGSDQVIIINEQIYGKPLTHEKAVQQLKLVSGSHCDALTGVCVLDAASGRYQVEAEPFRVEFRAFSEQMIESYLRKEKPYQCAGSIKSEGLGIALFERMIGDDPSSLEGLPLIRLVRMLEAFQVLIV